MMLVGDDSGRVVDNAEIRVDGDTFSPQRHTGSGRFWGG